MPRLYKMHREVKRVIGDDVNRCASSRRCRAGVSAVAFKRTAKFAAGSSLDGKGEVRVYDADDRQR